MAELPPKIKSLLGNLWPPLLLILITVIISYLNYETGTWLTGWDNLHPEFYPEMNIQRSLFAVWQEYQSLGLLGGMAHASDLLHQLFILGLSKTALAPSLFRYLYTFLMLGLGPIGTYFVIRYSILSYDPKTKPSLLHTIILSLLKRKDEKPKASFFDRQTKIFAAFIGGLFYLLNLATIQQFFTPFESFITFHAFFPWIIFTTLNYLKYQNKKTFFLMSLVYLLSAPSYYVETLFVVLILALLPIWIFNIRHHNLSLKSFASSFSSGLSLFITNAYWLLPLVLFVLTNGHVGEQSKINIISSPETYFRNLDFGNLKNIILLKGYWFTYIDLGTNQKFDFLLSVWRHHTANPSILLIGYFNFTLVAIGIYYGLKNRLNHIPAIAIMLLTSCFFLMGGKGLISDQIPLVGELFRSPFTKFTTPLTFAFSIFFSIGAIFLFDLFSFLHIRFTYYLTAFTLSLGLFIFCAPVFSGNLIYPALRQNIPSEYFQVFEFFKSESPSTRIANFPQYTFWGWNFYNWGYRGSGFLWYGIHQPILDRAFDVWENSGEKYYEEISPAIYSEDKEKFERLTDKYSINWLILDKNLISPDNPKIAFYDQLKNLIESSTKFELVSSFNNKISIYRVKLSTPTANFISLTPVTENSTPLLRFSPRPQIGWQIKNDQISIPVSTPILGNYLNFPSFTYSENIIPVKISYRKNFDRLDFRIDPLVPIVKIGHETFTPSVDPTVISIKLPTTNLGFILQIKDQFFEFQLPTEINYQKDYYPFATAYLPTHESVFMNLFANDQLESVDLTPFLLTSNPYQCYTQKPDRKVEKIIEGKSVSLITTDAVGCLSTPLPNTNDLISVSMELSSKTNSSGRANITNSALGGLPTDVVPLSSANKPKQIRIFSERSITNPQLNLILEANFSKSPQEITFENIKMFTHPLITSTIFKLNSIPKMSIKLPSPIIGQTEIIIPRIVSTFSINQTPEVNSLFPTKRNCDNYNNGPFDKIVTPTSITYTSENSISCDYISLPELPHNTSFAFTIKNQLKSGLPLITCLENHATGRCDIYERLLNSKESLSQTLIQEITNSNENPGFTLHLLNQSFGPEKTVNSLEQITITPLPLNFLTETFISNTENLEPISENQTGQSPDAKVFTTHPAEFLYTADITNPNPAVLNLYQTRSPFWIALEVPSEFTKLTLKQMTLQLPDLIVNLKNPNDSLIPQGSAWHNSWLLSPGNHHLVIFYLPQYLEFIGFALLPIVLIGFLCHPGATMKKNLFTGSKTTPPHQPEK